MHVLKVETPVHPMAHLVRGLDRRGAANLGRRRDWPARSRPKAGLTGFRSGCSTPTHGKPDHIASALQIMTEGPLGGAAFNNEFGRPNLNGYFRDAEQTVGGQR
jgi:phosphoribosylformylglycinamidine synthase